MLFDERLKSEKPLPLADELDKVPKARDVSTVPITATIKLKIAVKRMICRVVGCFSITINKVARIN